MKKCIILEVHVHVRGVGWVLSRKYPLPEYRHFPLFDRYRLEHIPGGANEYWIYDLYGVEKEPDDYKVKLKIRRVI